MRKFRDKKYWIDYFSKVHNDVRIHSIKFFELSGQEKYDKGIYCKSSNNIFIVSYSYSLDNIDTRQIRRWIQSVPISEIRKEKLIKIGK